MGTPFNFRQGGDNAHFTIMCVQKLSSAALSTSIPTVNRDLEFGQNHPYRFACQTNLEHRTVLTNGAGLSVGASVSTQVSGFPSQEPKRFANLLGRITLHENQNLAKFPAFTTEQ